jgi:Mrp family chromosome partitioning ATPase
MDVASLAAFVRTPRGLLALTALVAALAALGVSLTQPERFRASAEIWFGRTTDAPSLVAGGAGLGTVGEPRAANLALATLDSVAARVERRFPGPATADDLTRAVDVGFDRNSDLVTVTAERGAPSTAALLANAFADEIVALRRETARADVRRAIDVLRAKRRQSVRARRSKGGGESSRDEIRSLTTRVARLQLLKAVQTGNVHTVERAIPPREPSSPKPLTNAILASLVALIIGIFALVLPARVDRRLPDEDELTALIPASVLVRIPEARIQSGARAQQDAAFTEAFQFLALHLHLMRPQGQSLVVTVTSPADGDGKTTVVTWLARALTSSGADVVAVDCDLRNPELGSYLEDHEDVTQETVAPRPRLVSGAAATDPRSASIRRERLERMLGRLRDEADFVLLDAASVATTADATVVAASADAVILVVDLGGIRRGALLAAGRQLANSRAKTLGIVLNRARASSPAYVVREPGGARPMSEGLLGPPTFTV